MKACGLYDADAVDVDIEQWRVDVCPQQVTLSDEVWILIDVEVVEFHQWVVIA